jgi:hypothetical protein
VSNTTQLVIEKNTDMQTTLPSMSHDKPPLAHVNRSSSANPIANGQLVLNFVSALPNSNSGHGRLVHAKQRQWF